MPSGVYPRNIDLQASLIRRFWKAVIKHDGCWEWTKATAKHGYGMIGTGRIVVTAHRVSWEIHFGPIPEGIDVLHKCDNPPCSNPDHLFLGDHADNMADAVRKWRNARKLSKEQFLDIRQCYASGLANQYELAAKHGVTQAAVWYVLNKSKSEVIG